MFNPGYPLSIESTYGSGSGTTTRFLVARLPKLYWTIQHVWTYTYRVSTGITYNMASISIDNYNNIYIGAHYTADSGTNNTRITSTGTYSTNEWCVIVHKCKASISQSNTGTINGRSMTSTTEVSAPYTSMTTNGYSYNSFSAYAEGGIVIAEAILYNSSLSAGNTTLVENYLKSKWGISY